MGVLANFFQPRTVAVIGASAKKGKIGRAIVENLIASSFKGKILPVNPGEREILGLPCLTSVTQAKQEVDLAVIAVPGIRVPAVAEECGCAGVRHLVVVSAGFKEIGPEGAARERELVRVCGQYGMQLLGPNCVGMMDTHTPLNASFAKGFPLEGRIAFISQSGAMLLSILDWSRGTGVGFSQVVSLGNKAGLNEADFLLAAAADQQTQVIICYIEDVAEGGRFLRVARQVTREKPVVVLKSGVSAAGAQAASSHTGALAGSDRAYETAFRQAGVLRVHNMAELFDLAQAFANQPLPAGRRVAIVTNAGGPGIVTTDKVASNGLTMARFSKETTTALRHELPLEANVYNPVDVLGDADTNRYRLALSRVLADEGVDSAVVLLCPTAVTDPAAVARALLEVRQAHPRTPVVAAFMGGEEVAEGAAVLTRAGLPTFTFPEPAVRTLAGMERYRRLRERLGRDVPGLTAGLATEEARRLIGAVQRDRRLVLLGSEASQLAAAYGLPVSPSYLARTVEEALALSTRAGYPVVLKVASPKILHKSDVGGVRVGLRDEREVASAFQEIMERVHRNLPGAAIYGLEVQHQEARGTEFIVGMTRDPQFGPLLAFGLGGVYVNLLEDVAFRLADNLSGPEIQDMLAETKASAILRGYRGEPPLDSAALVQVVTGVAQLALDLPELAEMELNPVVAYTQGHGVLALDVKATITGPQEGGKGW